ncbi:MULTISPECIES: Flp family type IVb pilin [unclassified Sinorhizobium]|uniref:Flp family type IVb pilin n=1 Tax=unclassified Sinorhizobium TaxID=2613772 RepID=UPI0035234369
MSLILSFLRDKGGATAIEYGLIAALIAVALIAGFGGLSNNLANMFNMLSNTVDKPLP